jgi:hypothetical protein
MIRRRLALLLAVPPIAAQDPPAGPVWSREIVYVTTPGHPKSVAPGTGSTFALVSAGYTFGGPVVSDDGSHWIVRAAVEEHGSGYPHYLLDGQSILRSGQQAPWAAIGETVSTMSWRPDVNDAGEVAFVCKLDGTASGAFDRWVMLYSGGAFTVIAREGLSAGPLVPALAGVSWDDDLTTPGLTNAGLVSFVADYIDGPGITGLNDEVVIVGDTVHLQETTDGPSGLAGVANELWLDFADDNVSFSGDGQTSLVRGYTHGSFDDDQVLALNGVVVLQEGHPVPGGPFTSPIDGNGIFLSTLDAGSRWFARGRNADLQDWLVRDGIVLAFSEGLDEIVPGAGEHWSDGTAAICFFIQAGNASGAFVIGGMTDGPERANAVLVHGDGAGERSVAIREGDPIDLDEDGVFDDDRFIDLFGTDEAVLFPDDAILFTATLRDGAGAATDEGVFRLRPCGWEPYGAGASPVNTLELSGGGGSSAGDLFQATTTGATGAFVVTGVSLGASSFPLFGGVALLDPLQLVATPVATPAGGTAMQPIPIPADPTLAGVNVYLQSAADDATQPHGFALSNGLKVTICE